MDVFFLKNVIMYILCGINMTYFVTLFKFAFCKIKLVNEKKSNRKRGI